MVTKKDIEKLKIEYYKTKQAYLKAARTYIYSPHDEAQKAYKLFREAQKAYYKIAVRYAAALVQHYREQR